MEGDEVEGEVEDGRKGRRGEEEEAIGLSLPIEVPVGFRLFCLPVAPWPPLSVRNICLRPPQASRD